VVGYFYMEINFRFQSASSSVLVKAEGKTTCFGTNNLLSFIRLFHEQHVL
jgi:hypothetical protein